MRDAKPIQGNDNGHELWLFVDRAELEPGSILHAPIFYNCQTDEPGPLFSLPVESPVLAPAQGVAGGGEGGGR